MKATGIVREIDSLGRVVLPIELRRLFNIEKKDPVEIFVDENCIMIQKYQPSCIFCKNTDGIVDFKGKYVCPQCLAEIKA